MTLNSLATQGPKVPTRAFQGRKWWEISAVLLLQSLVPGATPPHPKGSFRVIARLASVLQGVPEVHQQEAKWQNIQRLQRVC